jgi:hypothetical protein
MAQHAALSQAQDSAHLMQPLGAGAKAMAAVAAFPSPGPSPSGLPVSRGASVLEEGVGVAGGGAQHPPPAPGHELSAGSVAGAPMAPGGSPERQSHRSKSWIGSLKL